MKKKKQTAVVFAMIFSLFSCLPAFAAEQPRFAEIRTTAENPEALYGEYIPVLMYHHFSIRSMAAGNGVVTTTEELENHLRAFQAAGWRVISLEELDRVLERAEETAADGGLGLNMKYLCITMDDGYYSNYELAYPLFRKYRMPASVFAVTDAVTEQTGLRKFTWREAAEMEESGYMKIYSHSADHIPAAEGQEEDFLYSMRKSEATLAENLKEKHSKAMAYPNGRYTEAIQEMLTADGYCMQFTIAEGVLTARTARDSMPRITVESGMSGQDVIQKIELVAEQQFAAAEREGR